jgi:hypothetical protein
MAPAVITAAIIGGTVVKGVSSVVAGVKKKKIAEEEAEYIESLGAQEEQEFRESGEEFKRGQRAALGASGAIIGTGSPLQLQAETARKIEEDALKIRHEYKHRAKQTRRGGQAALAEGIAGMGTTFLSGIERMYGFGQSQEWWK